MSSPRPFAIITGASTGIGFELAERCAKEGYDLLIAADEPEIEKATASLQSDGAEVEAVQADLATTEGVDKLYAAAKGRQVDALLANAGRGLGHGFLDQEARRVIDTNITGTVYLIHKVGNDMRRRNAGRILITGSIAGFIPGSFQAVYNGTTEKDDAAEVAKNGFDAMMKGEGDVVSGFKNKIQSAAANVTPAGVLASQHRKTAEPGTAKK